ncbi:MAG: mannose-1-phosphate guanylyltransferase [Sphingomonas sp.]|nr:mannose-1-phosphate guanylyltransferase [Sphingomonas sp.]
MSGNRRITPVVLCGGSGTRLWPLSRDKRAKPFLPLVGKETLFEQTLLRCGDRRYFRSPIIVTGAAYLQNARSEAAARQAAQFIVEPEARDTGAAVALAALRSPDDAVLLVCPSDHHIIDSSVFVERALAAAQLATDGWLVCFAIPARSPQTRFGYIRRGQPIGSGGFRVDQFIEKPDLSRAVSYLASGEFAWNSGIFALRAGDYIRELEKHRPALVEAVRAAVAHGREDHEFFYPDASYFRQIVPESIDYAVMEHTDKAAMVDTHMGWSDIGTWCAVQVARDRDEDGNSSRGPVELIDCQNVLVESDGPRVSIIGLEDAIVIVDGNDVMITTAAAAPKVGKLAAATRR